MPPAAASPVDIHPNVLVVDDDSDMREMAKMLLEPLGYRVDTAADGAQGLAAARMKPFDVVVMDVTMPSMDGIELGKALRGDPLTSSIGIIVHTALEEGRVRSSFVEYDVFLPKPSGPGTMLEALWKLVSHPLPRVGQGKRCTPGSAA